MAKAKVVVDKPNPASGGIQAFGTDARAKYKDLSFNDIMDKCIKDGHTAWLEEAMTRQMPHQKYQRTTIIDENGKRRRVVDKTKPKITELRKPTFIELKEMYLVEICGIPAAQQKPKPLTMAEKLALRLGQMEAEAEEANEE